MKDKKAKTMAIAYLDRKPVSRGKGQSIIAKAAYNSCSSLQANDGIKDFTKKTGLAYSQIITTGKSQLDRSTFWNNIETQEKRKDAQLGYSYEVALPIELTQEQNIRLAEDFTAQILKRYEFEAVDLSIHYPTKRKPHADQTKQNPHFHLLTPTRSKNGKKLRLFNDREDLLTIRKLWEETANKHLEEAGQETRISLDSAETQLKKLNEEISELNAKKSAIAQEILKIEEKINAEINAERGTKFRDNSTRENKRPKPADDPAGRGLQGSDENHKSSPEPAGSTSRERGSASNQTPPASNRRFRGKDRFPRTLSTRHLQTDQPLTNLAKRIASRLDALRYQRQAHCLKHPLSTLARQLASRIDGARYVRQQCNQEIENPFHYQTY